MSKESSLLLPLLNRRREGPTLNGAVLASILEVSPFSCWLHSSSLVQLHKRVKKKG